MWHERPVLYENVSKGYAHRNKLLAAMADMAEVFGISNTCYLEHSHAMPKTPKWGVINHIGSYI